MKMENVFAVVRMVILVQIVKRHQQIQVAILGSGIIRKMKIIRLVQNNNHQTTDNGLKTFNPHLFFYIKSIMLPKISPLQGGG